jgi:hypothetical protein
MFNLIVYGYEETNDDPDVHDIDDGVCTRQASSTGGYNNDSEPERKVPAVSYAEHLCVLET